MTTLQPTLREREQRHAVVRAILDATAQGVTIRLPAFDPALASPVVAASTLVGAEPNPYGGTVGPYRYQFEGEEDLLHLMVTRRDGGALSPEEGQAVCRFLLEGVPPAVIWLKPGELSQHFYVGHDELPGHIVTD